MAEKLNTDLNIIQRSGIEIQVDPLTRDLNIIQKLDDEPNDVGGLSAQELKAKFDEAGNAIKDYINDSLIPQVLSEGATEAQRQAAEAARQASETQRQTAEVARAAAETVRQSNETVRQSNETARSLWENYDPTHAYVPGNKVYYLGSSYVNKIPCTGIPPTERANWQLVAQRGIDGGSPYDYAVAGGYNGTEAEFQAAMGQAPWVPQAVYYQRPAIYQLPLAEKFTPYGYPSYNQYCKDAFGWVTVWLMAGSASGQYFSSDETVAVLPEGFRTRSNEQVFFVHRSSATGHLVNVMIDRNGVITASPIDGKAFGNIAGQFTFLSE